MQVSLSKDVASPAVAIADLKRGPLPAVTSIQRHLDQWSGARLPDAVNGIYVAFVSNFDHGDMWLQQGFSAQTAKSVSQGRSLGYSRQGTCCAASSAAARSSSVRCSCCRASASADCVRCCSSAAALAASSSCDMADKHAHCPAVCTVQSCSCCLQVRATLTMPLQQAMLVPAERSHMMTASGSGRPAAAGHAAAPGLHHRAPTAAQTPPLPLLAPAPARPAGLQAADTGVT